ncbi:MAG: helix-hairpin-helix domain-containing protein [Gemmatimonadales bacterium]|nr:helix-hairpin-helix domain-containing protein [Gemmatimonadales bacterium]
MRPLLNSRGAGRLRRAPLSGMILVLLVIFMTTTTGTIWTTWPGGSSGPTGAWAAEVGGSHAPVDLNSASLETVLGLPIDEEVARAIVNFRDYVRYFGDVYELMDVPGMTPQLLAVLKPLVSTMPPEVTDASLARLSASYRQMQRYLGQEGSSEGLANEYLDKMRNPENVNDMDLYDLMSYQNVSPVDATNILKAKERLGTFETGRQLRRSEGLRYWAYRNLRDFVVYSDEELEILSKHGATGYAQTRYTESPFSSSDDELGKAASGRPRGRFFVAEEQLYQPGWFNKIRIADRSVVLGVLTAREYGEKDVDETLKLYAGVSDIQLGDLRLKGLYVGNYRVAYGLGLVMDNTDFIHFRKTGFGFNKRLLGVHGDLSRSHEFALRGVAAEGSWGRINASGFLSSDRKDGILNPDGTINRYVLMNPRPEAEWLLEREVNIGYSDTPDMVPTGLRRDAFQEDILGGNIKVQLAPGTFVGLTGYEARYDRGFVADIGMLVDPDEIDNLGARDSEINNAYTSIYGEDEYKWRRVVGAEAQAVFSNTSLQGEYAFLQDPRNSFLSSDNSDALILNAYSQWENMHLLAIWRDYDVGFDNPYSRAFSNDSRYEMTLLSSPYYLQDDLYTWLETSTPQPKAEQGLYLETRYRISRSLILSQLAFDQWKRKADGADLMRYTIKGEYQPIFNLRFRVRHRYSSRSEANPTDVRVYRNWETRWQMIAMLSNYNRLQFTYMTSNVMFPPRPRLIAPVDPSLDGNYSLLGSAGMPASAFEVRYEHQVTPGLKMTYGSSVYDGFMWNFEGNEFVLLDGNGFRNWFKVESRVSERMLFQLKVTRDHNMPKTYVDSRSFLNIDYAENPDAQYVPGDDTIVRLQMDYTF